MSAFPSRICSWSIAHRFPLYKGSHHIRRLTAARAATHLLNSSVLRPLLGGELLLPSWSEQTSELASYSQQQHRTLSWEEACCRQQPQGCTRTLREADFYEQLLSAPAAGAASNRSLQQCGYGGPNHDACLSAGSHLQLSHLGHSSSCSHAFRGHLAASEETSGCRRRLPLSMRFASASRVVHRRVPLRWFASQGVSRAFCSGLRMVLQRDQQLLKSAE
mmetsp:Transcript_16165/g.43558  ORF Transcript_16165/g.43558 Transcript_16165/m.43558 type:complete len:219 (-) Transcript_16165:267-923(-)